MTPNSRGLGAGQQITDQLPVPVLEDMQRQQQTRVKNGAQRKQRQQLAHRATRFAWHSALRASPPL